MFIMFIMHFHTNIQLINSSSVKVVSLRALKQKHCVISVWLNHQQSARVLMNNWCVQSAFWTWVHSQDLQIVCINVCLVISITQTDYITILLLEGSSTHTFQHEEQLRDTGTAVNPYFSYGQHNHTQVSLKSLTSNNL